MKRIFSRSTALLLTFLLLLSSLPLPQPARADNRVFTLDDGYLLVTVNSNNGGFHVRTVAGNKLNKDDNDKDLLFSSLENDTSFTSFRVTKAGESKDYLFGGKYPGSQGPAISQVGNTILVAWSVPDFRVVQKIELVPNGQEQHGMAQITYEVENKSGGELDVKARLLLDTAFDDQDFGYYHYPVGDGSIIKRVETEQTLLEGEYQSYFFAYDDLLSPTTVSYAVHTDASVRLPERVAFGHWNNLAATLYEFTPTPEFNFTTKYNEKYLTADSAFALYYDLGPLANGDSQTIGTYYGVYSNAQAEADQQFTMHLVAPKKLELTADKKSYTDSGRFSISTEIENITAGRTGKVAVVVRPQNGIRPIVNGQVKDFTQKEPHRVVYRDGFPAGTGYTVTWDFEALVGPETEYRKIKFEIYDISGDDASGEAILANNLLLASECYIACPGGEGNLPEIQFTGLTPQAIYTTGTRYLYLTGSKFNLLFDENTAGAFSLVVRREDGGQFSGSDHLVVPKERFIIDAAANSAQVMFTEELPEGQYRLELDYGSGRVVSSPALSFGVSSHPGLKSQTYGIVTVEKQGSGAASKYEIKLYGGEVDYQKTDRSRVLLEFRGDFTALTAANGDITSVTGVSLNKNDNVMNLNGVIDIKDGNMTIINQRRQESPGGPLKSYAIDVDFDASLYTTGANTLIFKGSSCLTSLTQGADFGLIPYDSNGERVQGAAAPFNMYTASGDKKQQEITLIWASTAGGGLQSIAGMVLGMRYGELGVMLEDNKEARRLLSFGAELDLGFLIPKSLKPDLGEEGLRLVECAWDKFISELGDFETAETADLRAFFADSIDNVKGRGDDADDKITASINVQDVLFGGRFLGFICSAEVKLPAFVEGLPEIEGKLDIKTVGDWSFAVEGSLTFATMTLEASLGIKSYNGFPIPDKFYLFVGGFVPGINVDGYGVFWIMGGGGGIDNLYDTIFSPGKVPPLTLMLSLQANIMQVFSARADASLSLRGFDIVIRDGTLMATDTKIINFLRLRLDWYPEFYFLAAADISILDIIYGGGYIVVENDGFFEFYVRAGVQIPDDIPFIGGIKVAAAEMGASFERIFGVIDVIGLKYGVVYYWGGDVEFGSASDLSGAGPTYPELLESHDAGRAAVPVAYDAGNGRTLFMAPTNLSVAAAAGSGNSARGSMLLGGAVAPELKSNAAKTNHTLMLPSGRRDYMLQMSFAADSYEDACAFVKEGISFTTEVDDIRLLDRDQPADAEANKDANANLTYDATTQTAGLALALHGQDVQLDYSFTTTRAATLMLLDVGGVPALTGLTVVSQSGDQLEVTVLGKDLSALDSISFFLENVDNEADVLLIGKVLTGDIEGDDLTGTPLTLPATLPGGTYKVRATGFREGLVSQSIYAAAALVWTNSRVPNAPGDGFGVEYAGDMLYALTNLGVTDFDGLNINVYEQNAEDGGQEGWNLTDLRNIRLTKDDDLVFGGTFQRPVFRTNVDGTLFRGDDGQPVLEGTVSGGLEAGKTYRVGVSTYKVETSAGEELPTYFSLEVLSAPFSPSSLVATTLAVSPASGTALPRALSYAWAGGEAVTRDTYGASDLNLVFTASGAQQVSGQWELDGGRLPVPVTGEVAESSHSFTVSLTALAEGEHTITFLGRDSHKNTVRHEYPFVVDTLPPALLLDELQNGAFFAADGSLTVTGITEAGAKLTVAAGSRVLATTAAIEVDEAGRFALPLSTPLDKTKASHTLTITAADRMGNETAITVTLHNQGLGSITDWRVYAAGQDVTGLELGDLEVGYEVDLSLWGVVSVGGQTYEIEVNNPSLVEWELTLMAGRGSVSTVGHLALEAGARGMVLARFLLTEDVAISRYATFGKSTVDNNGEPRPPQPPSVTDDDSDGGEEESWQVSYVRGNEGQRYYRVQARIGLVKEINDVLAQGTQEFLVDLVGDLPPEASGAPLQIRVPTQLVQRLVGLDVVFITPYGELRLPEGLIEVLAASGQAINIYLEKASEEGVLTALREGDLLLTAPVEITTALQGQVIVTLSCNLPLPTNAAEREAYLATLYVLGIHGPDDRERITDLRLHIDEDTNSLRAVTFSVQRFSTFALIAGDGKSAAGGELLTHINGRVYYLGKEGHVFDSLTAYRADPATTVIAVRLLEELGAQIAYVRKDSVGEVTVSYGGIKALLREKSDLMIVEEAGQAREVTLRTTFTNLNGRTYLPTRDVAENLGFRVHWQAQDDSITIK